MHALRGGEVSVCGRRKGYREILANLKNTVYFNFKFLPFCEAVHLPVIVYRNVRIKRCSRGKAVIVDKASYRKIRLGFPCLRDRDAREERMVLALDGKLVFQGEAFLAGGMKLNIEENGMVTFGRSFFSSGPCEIVCEREIEFGDDCAVSWDTLFMDTDSHTVWDSKKERKNHDRGIKVGEHCWIGCRATVFKGVHIPDNCMVAGCSVITKSFEKENCMIGGNPCRILREDIEWDMTKPAKN